MDKKIFRDVSYGMYIVTTTDKNNKKVGCVIREVDSSLAVHFLYIVKFQ